MTLVYYQLEWQELQYFCRKHLLSSIFINKEKNGAIRRQTFLTHQQEKGINSKLYTSKNLFRSIWSKETVGMTFTGQCEVKTLKKGDQWIAQVRMDRFFSNYSL